MRRAGAVLCLVFALGVAACDDAHQPLENRDATPQLAGGRGGTINILLKTPVTEQILADLSTRGTVSDVIEEINAVILQVSSNELKAIRALPYVAAANPDAERRGAPVDAVSAENFAGGLSTWNMDAVNVTAAPGLNQRAVPYDGSGVFVGVLDTGLLDSWRQYFPQERIAEEFAKAFGGGGGGKATCPSSRTSGSTTATRTART